jgi:hypothetical protein
MMTEGSRDSWTTCSTRPMGFYGMSVSLVKALSALVELVFV